MSKQIPDLFFYNWQHVCFLKNNFNLLGNYRTLKNWKMKCNLFKFNVKFWNSKGKST